MHSSRFHLAVSSVLIEIMNSSITLLLLLIPFASSIRDDVQCLRDFKSSVSDPDGHLATWSFPNFTEGFLCSFTGVSLLAKFYAPEIIVVDGRMPPAKAVQGSTRQWSDDRLRPTSRNVLVRVSLFKEPMEEVMVADLMAATADFHPDNVVVAGCSDAGTSYKAVLWDGSALTVKRIRECPLSDQQFRRVMCTNGEVYHPNLVPLLGFCVAGLEDRLMIYKNMPNGALSSLLENWDEHLDWPTRLKIGIGTARGLAWLHHGFPAPLLHQNFSSSAVLLDEDYEPRITDFGLASLFSTTSSKTFQKNVG